MPQLCPISAITSWPAASERIDQHDGADAHEQHHRVSAGATAKPVTGRNTSETIAAPIEISTVVANGSSPPLMVAFHPAWHAAANKTATKTNESMAKNDSAACGSSSLDGHGPSRLRGRSTGHA